MERSHEVFFKKTKWPPAATVYSSWGGGLKKNRHFLTLETPFYDFFGRFFNMETPLFLNFSVF